MKDDSNRGLESANNYLADYRSGEWLSGGVLLRRGQGSDCVGWKLVIVGDGENQGIGNSALVDLVGLQGNGDGVIWQEC